jgi:hypothetical protein
LYEVTPVWWVVCVPLNNCFQYLSVNIWNIISNHDGISHTTHHTCVTSYNSSYRCYFIQLIIQVLLHTAHHTGVTSYNSSYRCYFIQLIIQVLLHTAHHTGVTSYSSSYRCYFIQLIIQVLLHTAHHTGVTSLWSNTCMMSCMK